MRFREWFADVKLDLTDWTSLGPEPKETHHLWRTEGGWGDWTSVTDDYEVWEFRECVLCGTKQIREFQS